MSKHIVFNEGILSARYDSNININIPEDAMEVSDEIFIKTINETDGIWSLVKGKIVKLPFPAPTTAELIAAKLKEINVQFEQAMRQITSSYPVSETTSWAKQESEARAFIEDSNMATPLVDALAAARGLPKQELVDRIIAKADLFAPASGQLIGKRQKLEDEIAALPPNATPESIAAIVW